MENEQIIECLLCGGTAELKHKEYPGYQESDVFKIYHCPLCNTAFSLPRGDTTSIYESIYINGDKVPGYNRYWKYAETVKVITNPLDYLAKEENTYWGVKEALSLSVNDKKTTKILEIGSGLGYLTYSLIKANYDAIGLDISQTAVRQANEAFGNHYICADLFEYAQIYPESFDIVILTEVIEHIDKPLDFTKSILKLLKPKGRVIITTPNKSLYPLDTIWASDIPPVHCWWFSEDSMKYMAKKLNLNISLINFSKYYKNNYQSVDMKPILVNQLPKPYFYSDGKLIVQNNTLNKPGISYLKMLISKFPNSKNIYHILKDLLKPDIIVCKDRGTILCAIFQKPKS